MQYTANIIYFEHGLRSGNIDVCSQNDFSHTFLLSMTTTLSPADQAPFLEIFLKYVKTEQIISCLRISDSKSNSYFHLLALQKFESADCAIFSSLFQLLKQCQSNLNGYLNTDKKNPLHVCVEAGNDLLLRVYVNFIPHVNAQDRFGNTALHYAVKLQNLVSIKALLRVSADPGINNNELETPLTIATVMADVMIQQCLTNSKSKNAGFCYGPLVCYDPPMIQNANCAFEAENDLEVSLQKNETAFVLLQLQGWFLIETLSKKKGIVSHWCLNEWNRDKNSNRRTLDYLIDDSLSLYHLIERNGLFFYYVCLCLFLYFCVFMIFN
jgi:hypothetical protein